MTRIYQNGGYRIVSHANKATTERYDHERSVRIFLSYYESITTDPDWQVRDHYAAPGEKHTTGTIYRLWTNVKKRLNQEDKEAFRKMYEEMCALTEDAEYSDAYMQPETPHRHYRKAVKVGLTI